MDDFRPAAGGSRALPWVALPWVAMIGGLAALAAATVPALGQPASPPGATGGQTVRPAPDQGPAGSGTAVIRPPANVDPGISQAKPPADAGTMPVLPPPGTPGGDQNVQPK